MQTFGIKFWIVMVIVVVLVGPAMAADASSPIELSLQARAIESPKLKYRLFPSEFELKAGNAAPILLRLPWEQTAWMSKVFPTLQEWEARPLTAREWANAGGLLPATFYAEMKRAAYRRDADWEYPLHETASPYFILLPDVQGLRTFLSYGLGAKIRYHLSQGDLEQAREGILVGLANGRHLARTPFYINQLVAAAVHRTMLARVEELISQSNSPNLYWALSTLPDCLVELEQAASFESRVFALTLPAAENLGQARDASEWSKMAAQLVDLLEQLEEIPTVDRPKADGAAIKEFFDRLVGNENSPLAAMVNRAREELPELAGIDAAQVASMSNDEVAVRWYVLRRLARDQHTAAVMLLPPTEAWRQFPALFDEIDAFQTATNSRGNESLRPENIYVSVWSIKRRVDALRVIEAARHFAANHEGQWPKTLEDVTDVPVPIDPLTEEPFQWTVDGQTATLATPPLPASVFQRTGRSEKAKTSAGYTKLEYHLKLKP